MERVLAMIIAVMLILTLGVGAASAKTIKATFVGIMQGGAAWSMAEKGFLDACKDLGWDGQYVAPAQPNDVMVMLELAETAITTKNDVLIGTFIDVDVFGDTLKRAREEGIYVATTNVYLGEEYQNFWIGTDPEGMGIAQAKTLAELAGDKEVKVVYLQTSAIATTQNQQFAAFTEYLKDFPNISVFGQEYCDSQETLAAEKIANLVKANPEINAVVCADGNGAIGTANYVDENDVEEDFISVGIDDSAVLLNYVKSGALDCTIAQDFYAMGYKSCTMINDIMNGIEHPFHNDSGTIVIMPDYVDTYAAEKGIEISN